MASYRIWKGTGFNGQSAFAALTVGTANTKLADKTTGKLVDSITILSDSAHPVEAVKSGQDETVCGDCPMRPLLAKAAKAKGLDAPECYVNKLTGGPGGLWKAREKMEGMEAYNALIAKGKRWLLRFGAYGEPVLLGSALVAELIKGYRMHTGYTHQWRRADNAWAAGYFMASVASAEERMQAKQLGYRTFRVAPLGTTPEPGEVVCPASASNSEADKKTCSRCPVACNGNKPGKRMPDILEYDHGPGSLVRNAVRRKVTG